MIYFNIKKIRVNNLQKRNKFYTIIKKMNMEMKKTLFIDIDGTLFKHRGNLSNIFLDEAELLPGVIEKINKWNADGHIIILTTGRAESMREITNKELEKNGIFYNQLIL